MSMEPRDPSTEPITQEQAAYILAPVACRQFIQTARGVRPTDPPDVMYFDGYAWATDTMGLVVRIKCEVTAESRDDVWAGRLAGMTQWGQFALDGWSEIPRRYSLDMTWRRCPNGCLDPESGLHMECRTCRGYGKVFAGNVELGGHWWSLKHISDLILWGTADAEYKVVQYEGMPAAMLLRAGELEAIVACCSPPKEPTP